MSAGRRRPAGGAPAPSAAEAAPRDTGAVLFNRGRPVTVQGLAEDQPVRTYVVRRWSIQLLDEVSNRLPDLLQDLFEGGASADAAASLIPGAILHMRWIVARTLGLDEDEINLTWSAEDLVDVAAVVVEVCVVPLSGKFLALGNKMLAMLPKAQTMPTPALPSPAPSSS